MTKADILKKKAMIEALEKTIGVVTSATKKVGISRETHYRWLREDKDYKAAVDGIEDIAIDFAESQLHQQIKSGNTAATIFFLKCKAKRRGYIEKDIPENQIIIQPGENAVIDLGGGIILEI